MPTDIKIRLVIFGTAVAACLLSWWLGRIGGDSEVRKLQGDVRDEHNDLLNEQIASRKLSSELAAEKVASNGLREELEALQRTADRVAKRNVARSAKAKRKAR